MTEAKGTINSVEEREGRISSGLEKAANGMFQRNTPKLPDIPEEAMAGLNKVTDSMLQRNTPKLQTASDVASQGEPSQEDMPDENLTQTFLDTIEPYVKLSDQEKAFIHQQSGIMARNGIDVQEWVEDYLSVNAMANAMGISREDVVKYRAPLLDYYLGQEDAPLKFTWSASMINSFKQGQRQNELAKVQERYRNLYADGIPYDSQYAQYVLGEVRQKQKEMEYYTDAAPHAWLVEKANNAIQQIPYSYKGFWPSLVANAIGNLVLPGSGDVWGKIVRTGIYYGQFAGAAFWNMLEAGVSPETAYRYSAIDGVLNALNEAFLDVGYDALAGLVSGSAPLTEIAASLLPDIVNDISSKGALPAYLVKLLFYLGLDSLGEFLQESSQEFTSWGIQSIAEKTDGVPQSRNVMQALKDSWDAGVQGWEVGMFFGLVPATARTLVLDIPKTTMLKNSARKSYSREAFVNDSKNRERYESMSLKKLSAEDIDSALGHFWDRVNEASKAVEGMVGNSQQNRASGINQKIRGEVLDQFVEDMQKDDDTWDRFRNAATLTTGEIYDRSGNVISGKGSEVKRMADGKLFYVQESNGDGTYTMKFGNPGVVGRNGVYEAVLGEEASGNGNDLTREYLKSTEGTVMEQVGEIRFRIDDKTGALTIEGVTMVGDDATLMKDAVNQLREMYGDYGITWNTQSETEKSVYDSIVKDNPRGEDHKMNYTERTFDSKDKAEVERWLGVNFSRDANERSLLALVVMGAARRMGMSGMEFIDKYIAGIERYSEADAEKEISANWKAKGKTSWTQEEMKAEVKKAMNEVKGGTKTSEINGQVKATIYAGEHADPTTFMHELDHLIMLLGDNMSEFTEIMEKVKGTDRFKAFVRRNLDIIAELRKKGADGKYERDGKGNYVLDEEKLSRLYHDKDNWTREEFEVEARLAEAWRRSGKTLNPEMKGFFRRIAEIMRNVYYSMRNGFGNVELNDEVVEFFDRLYGYDANGMDKGKDFSNTQLRKIGTLMQTAYDQEAMGEGQYDEQIIEERQQVVDRYKGTDQWMKAPNGKATNLTEDQWITVRTQSFIKWFGDWLNDPQNASKAVDENGEPRVFYHGSYTDDIEVFRDQGYRNLYNNSNAHRSRGGVSFTSDKSIAESYAEARETFEEDATSLMKEIDDAVKSTGAYEVINHPDRENAHDKDAWDRGRRFFDALERSKDSFWKYEDEEMFPEFQAVYWFEEDVRGDLDLLTRRLADAIKDEFPEEAQRIREARNLVRSDLNSYEEDGYTNPKVYEVFLHVAPGTKEEHSADRHIALKGPVDVSKEKTGSYILHIDGAEDIVYISNSNDVKSATENNGHFDENSDSILRQMEDDDLASKSPSEQYNAVKERYRGTSQYMMAPNGMKTNLTERQWVQVRTPAFKEWFGDWENDPQNASKVIDENGEPKAVYHGTAFYGFEEFDAEDKYVWFASDRRTADNYARNSESIYDGVDIEDEYGLDYTPSTGIYQVFLNIRKPLSFGDIEINDEIDNTSLAEALNEANGIDLFDPSSFSFDSSFYGDPVYSKLYNGDILEAVNNSLWKKGEEQFDGLMIRDDAEVDGDITWAVWNSRSIKSATDNNGAFSSNEDSILRQTNESNLTPRQQSQVRTENFMQWSNGWKDVVKDENGEPKVLYHATDKNFDVFENQSRIFNQWFYFSSDRNWSRRFMNSRGITSYHMLPVYIKEGNVLDLSQEGEHTGREWLEILMSKGIDANDQYFPGLLSNERVGFWQVLRYDMDGDHGANILQAMQRAGFDSIHMDDNAGGDTYVVSDPNRIKSATRNNGAFSQDEDSILRQLNNTAREHAGIEFENKINLLKTKYQNVVKDKSSWENKSVNEFFKAFRPEITRMLKEYPRVNIDGLDVIAGISQSDIPFLKEFYQAKFVNDLSMGKTLLIPRYTKHLFQEMFGVELSNGSLSEGLLLLGDDDKYIEFKFCNIKRFVTHANTGFSQGDIVFAVIKDNVTDGYAKNRMESVVMDPKTQGFLAYNISTGTLLKKGTVDSALEFRLRNHSIPHAWKEDIETFHLDNEYTRLFDYVNKNSLDNTMMDYEEYSRAHDSRTPSEISDSSDTMLSQKVNDPETVRKYETEETITTYRAMQKYNGQYYSPMAKMIKGKPQPGLNIGDVVSSEGHPEYAIPVIDKKTGLQSIDKKTGRPRWQFPLEKGEYEMWPDGTYKLDKKGRKIPLITVPAAYNPYIHSSLSMLNDQFSTAYKRPNLVVVEVQLLKSDVESGFWAEKAKDPVGATEWKAGPVAGKLAKKNGARVVYLSTSSKLVREVPASEVAQNIKGMLEGTDVTIPDNVVTPSLLEELKNLGVPITESEEAREWNQYIEDMKSMEQEASRSQAQAVVDESMADAGEGSILNQYAYHGSGASFQQFLTEYINSGAGSQAFGWGLYFSESDLIGKAYAADLSFDTEEDKQHEVEYWQNRLEAAMEGVEHEKKRLAEALDANSEFYRSIAKSKEEQFRRGIERASSSGGIFAKAYSGKTEADIPQMVADEMAKLPQTLRGYIKDYEKDIRTFSDKVEYARNSGVGRNLYKVDLPDTGWLEWEGNVTDYPGLVEKVAAKVKEYNGGDDREIYGSFKYGGRVSTLYAYISDALFDTEAPGKKSDEKASRLLNELGYTGFRYDAGSNFGVPAGAEGAKNFVVFNQDDVKIVDHWTYQSDEDAPDTTTDRILFQRDVPDEIAKEAMDSLQDFSISERARIAKNMEEHKDTPWYNQVVFSLLARRDMKALLEGREIPENSILNDKSVTPKIKAALSEGIEGVFNYINQSGIIGNPSKPKYAVNSSLVNCNPSKDCAKFCYASKGRYELPSNIVKSELINLAVEADPIRAARMTALQYKATTDSNTKKALRIFDKGDFSASYVKYVQELNRQGVATQIFSKRPEFLSQIDQKFNVIMLSIDASNVELAANNPDLPLAIVYSGERDNALIAENKERFEAHGGVILPVKIGNRYLSANEMKDMPDWARRQYTCPIDAGKLKIGEWTCRDCDKTGRGGCFFHRSEKDRQAIPQALDRMGEGEKNEYIRKFEQIIREELAEEAFAAELRRILGRVALLRSGELVDVDTSRTETGNRESEGDSETSGGLTLRQTIVEMAESHEGISSIEDLYATAEKDMPYGMALIDNAAVATNARYMYKRTKLKGLDRATEKINNDYQGDARKLKDVYGGTLVFDGADEINAARKILLDGGVLPVFSRGKDTEAGYHYWDSKINFYMPNGTVGEIILIDNYIDIIKNGPWKEDMSERASKGIGHLLYETTRKFSVALGEKYSGVLSKDQRVVAYKIMKTLEEVSNEIYGNTQFDGNLMSVNIEKAFSLDTGKWLSGIILGEGDETVNFDSLLSRESLLMMKEALSTATRYSMSSKSQTLNDSNASSSRMFINLNVDPNGAVIKRWDEVFDQVEEESGTILRQTGDSQWMEDVKRILAENPSDLEGFISRVKSELGDDADRSTLEDIYSEVNPEEDIDPYDPMDGMDPYDPEDDADPWNPDSDVDDDWVVEEEDGDVNRQATSSADLSDEDLPDWMRDDYDPLQGGAVLEEEADEEDLRNTLINIQEATPNAEEGPRTLDNPSNTKQSASAKAAEFGAILVDSKEETRKFLRALRRMNDIIFGGDTDQLWFDPAEEPERYEMMKTANEDLEKGASQFIRNLVYVTKGSDATKLENLSDRNWKIVAGQVAANASLYMDLYYRATGDENWAGYVDLESRVKAELGIESGKYRSMSFAEKRKLAEQLDDNDLKEKLLRGGDITDEDLKGFVRRQEARIRAAKAELEALKDRDNAVIDAKKKEVIDLSLKAQKAEKALADTTASLDEYRDALEALTVKLEKRARSASLTATDTQRQNELKRKVKGLQMKQKQLQNFLDDLKKNGGYGKKANQDKEARIRASIKKAEDEVNALKAADVIDEKEAVKRIERLNREWTAYRTAQAVKEIKEDIRKAEAARRAARKLRGEKERLARQIMRKPSDNVHIDEAEKIIALQETLDPAFRSRMKVAGNLIDINDLKAKFRTNPGDPALSTLTEAQLLRIAKKSLDEMTLGELEQLADTISNLRSQGLQKRMAYVLGERQRIRTIQNDLIAQIRASEDYREPAFGGGDDEARRKKSLPARLRTMALATYNMARKAQMMDGDRKGAFYDLLVRQKRACQDVEMRAQYTRTQAIRDAMAQAGVKPEDLYSTVNVKFDFGTVEYSVAKLGYVYLANNNVRNREAVSYGVLVSDDEKRLFKNAAEKSIIGDTAEAKKARADFVNDRVRQLGDARWNILHGEAEAYMNTHAGVLAVVKAIEADFNSKGFDRVVDIMRKVYNVDVERDSYYLPNNRDGFVGTDPAEKVRNDLMNTIPGTKGTVEKGFTKSKIDIPPVHQSSVNMDLFQVWQQSVRDQEHLLSTVEYVRTLNGVFENKSLERNVLRNMISSTYGDAMMEAVDMHLKEIADPDAGSLQKNGRDELMKLLKGNVYSAYLGFKLSAVTNQLITSPAAFLGKVGPVRLGMKMLQFTTSWKSSIEKVHTLSAFMRSRNYDIIAGEISENAKNVQDPKLKRTWAQIQEFGLKGLEFIDEYCVSAGWLAIYEQEIERLGGLETAENVREAVKIADEYVMETQPLSDKTELAPMFKDKNEAMNILTQFQSSLNVVWQNVTYDVPKAFKNHAYRMALGTIVGYMMAGALMGLAHGDVNGKDEDDDRFHFWKFMLRLLHASTTQFTEGIPLVSSNVEDLTRLILTGDKPEFSTSQSVFPAFTKDIQALEKTAEAVWSRDPEDFQKALEYAIDGTELTLGLPYSMIREVKKIPENGIGALVGYRK